ncbi:MAG: hypothetical protein HYZ75_12900 [Elusimicrobia bacterium]|nr:hypothetical protein [Elusimicrobiota bacterium]
MTRNMLFAAVSALSWLAAPLSAGDWKLGLDGTQTGPRVCAISRPQCLIFWKAKDGPEFMGGAAVDCEFAKSAVADGNKAPKAADYWLREVWVNADIDIVSDCRPVAEAPSICKSYGTAASAKDYLRELDCLTGWLADSKGLDPKTVAGERARAKAVLAKLSALMSQGI